MSPADLTATLASVQRAGVRWRITEGGVPVPGVKQGATLDESTRAVLASLRPYRNRLATIASTGRCPDCGVCALPPLVVCYWCQAGQRDTGHA